MKLFEVHSFMPKIKHQRQHSDSQAEEEFFTVAFLLRKSFCLQLFTQLPNNKTVRLLPEKAETVAGDNHDPTRLSPATVKSNIKLNIVIFKLRIAARKNVSI